MRLRALGASAFAVAAAIASGCAAHLTTPSVTPTQSPTGGPTSAPSGGGIPSSLPTAASTATPQPCGSAQDASIYVAMSFGIAPAGSQYGILFGYGAVDSAGNVPAFAAPIEANVGDTVQFANLDAYDPSNVTLRSAASFTGATSFPSIPYSFPPAQYSALNTAIGSSAWSTGLILSTPSTGSPCYSRTFALSATGTYYFGDILYYNDYVASPRGVVVVTNAAHEKSPRKARALPRVFR